LSRIRLKKDSRQKSITSIAVSRQRRRQAPSGKPETHGSRQTAESVTYASPKIDPAGRVISYVYASNGVDLLEKRQT